MENARILDQHTPSWHPDSLHRLSYQLRKPVCAAGAGNRCLLGPVAAAMAEFSSRYLGVPRHIAGKHGEPELVFYELSLAVHCLRSFSHLIGAPAHWYRQGHRSGSTGSLLANHG